MIARILILAAALCIGIGPIALVPTAQARTDIHSERSLYRNIVVYEEDGVRCMIFNKRSRSNARQTCMKLAAPDELVFNFTKMMMASLYLDPNPKDILIVGFGGGTLAHSLLKILPEARIDAVEVDRAVIAVADKFFNVRPSERLAIFEADGRTFVKRQVGKKTYDLVMLDAFDEDYIPEHMLTREFLAELKQVMNPNAVLAANTFTTSALYDHESATYHAAFGDFYNLKTNNRIILTRLGGPPPMSEIEKNAAAFDDAFKPLGVERNWLLPMFSTKIDWKRDARILTDQYSPSNLLNSRGR
jgi:spermidine synthase